MIPFRWNRWRLLASLALGGALGVAIACGGETELVKETVVVERVVEKEVPQTVVVEKEKRVTERVVETVVVEKEVPVEVEQTVVVEKIKEVVPTATPVPKTFFGLPLPPEPEAVGSEPPDPKTDSNRVLLRSKADQGLGVCGWPEGGCGSSGLGMSITEKFFNTDKGGNAVPQLVTDWTLDVSDGSGSLTVNLKQGVPWHGDFGELTSEDVVWSLNTGNPGFNPNSITDGGSAWVSFIGANPVEAIDTYTVKIPVEQFDIRWDTFLFGQSGLGLSIFSKKAFDEKGKDWTLTNLVGTGPFEVEDVAPDDFLKLKRVENHHRLTPKIEFVEQRLIPDDTVAEALLKTGDVDVSDVKLRNIKAFTKAGFDVISAGAGSFHTISFSGNYWETEKIGTGDPLERPALSRGCFPWVGVPDRPDYCSGEGDPPEGMTSMERARMVRKALSHAINRDEISEVLFSAVAWPNYVYGHDINNPNYKDEWKVEYDPAKAERMLDEAGWPRGEDGIRFQLPFFIRLGRGDEDIGTAVAGYWREIGIDVIETRAQYTVFRPNLIGRTATQPWIHSAGAESPHQPWDWAVMGPSESSLGRPSGYNVAFEDRFIGETFIKMNAESDKQKRIELRNQLAQHIFDEAIAIGTVARPNVALANPKKIASWDMPISVREAAFHAPEYIEPTQ